VLRQSDGAAVICDGCRDDVEPTLVHSVVADGHGARYCDDCHNLYQTFVEACQSEENRLNRLLTLKIDELRHQVPLHFVPQDLPAVERACAHMTPLVLR
jgi:hypothetical protein